jgi:hypothetical protein
MLYAFLLLTLLLTGDWMYAASLLEYSLATWPFSFRKTKGTSLRERKSLSPAISVAARFQQRHRSQPQRFSAARLLSRLLAAFVLLPSLSGL